MGKSGLARCRGAIYDRPGAVRAALAALAALGALAGLPGCFAFLRDDRPWLVNSTAEKLEVESTHTDGHRLKIVLYPGTRVPLGAAAEAIREIAVRRPRVPELLVPESTIRACLEDPTHRCLGWDVSARGLELLARSSGS